MVIAYIVVTRLGLMNTVMGIHVILIVTVHLTLAIMASVLYVPILYQNFVIMHLVLSILIVLLVLVSILFVSNVPQELVQVVIRNVILNNVPITETAHPTVVRTMNVLVVE